MRGLSDYAAIYDISADTERARVDKILKGFGFRVQKSVFECRMNKKTKKELIEKLEDLHIETGFIKIYRLDYCSKNEIIGKPCGQGVDDENAFIV